MSEQRFLSQSLGDLWRTGPVRLAIARDHVVTREPRLFELPDSTVQRRESRVGDRHLDVRGAERLHQATYRHAIKLPSFCDVPAGRKQRGELPRREPEL